jgi:hypothetical protein
MKAVIKIRQKLDAEWIPDIYLKKVRPLRTRSYELDIPASENKTEIFETLLGFELKVGQCRIACPDLVTTRYLRIFVRLGCKKIAVPYDITATPLITDQLERAWEAAETEIQEHSSSATPQQKGRVRAAVIRVMRNEIEKAGAGELMPLFNRSTKQRHS